MPSKLDQIRTLAHQLAVVIHTEHIYADDILDTDKEVIQQILVEHPIQRYLSLFTGGIELLRSNKKHQYFPKQWDDRRKDFEKDLERFRKLARSYPFESSASAGSRPSTSATTSQSTTTEDIDPNPGRSATPRPAGSWPQRDSLPPLPDSPPNPPAPPSPIPSPPSSPLPPPSLPENTDNPANMAHPPFNPAQVAQLQDLIRQTFEHYRDNETPQPPPPPPQNAVSQQTPFKLDEVGFFNPEAEAGNGQGSKDAAIVMIGQHPYFRNVYAFVDRLKDVAGYRGQDTIKNNMLGFLRGSAMEWYTTELSDLEKELLRGANLENWYKALIGRFKERTSQAMKNITLERYTMADVRTGKNVKQFAQKMFYHAKAAGMDSDYNLLTLLWTNIDIQLRQHLPQPTPTTSKADFLKVLDEKWDIWRDLADRQSSIVNRGPNRGQQGSYRGNAGSNQYPQFSYRQNGRTWQPGNWQSDFARRPFNPSYNNSNAYQSYRPQGNFNQGQQYQGYQGYQGYQNPNPNRPALPSSKPVPLLTAGPNQTSNQRQFTSNNSYQGGNQQYPRRGNGNGNFRGGFRGNGYRGNGNRYGQRVGANVAHGEEQHHQEQPQRTEQDENAPPQDEWNDAEDYQHDQDTLDEDYYPDDQDQSNYPDDTENYDASVFHVRPQKPSIPSTCNRCQTPFTSRNKLHQHLRAGCKPKPETLNAFQAEVIESSATQTEPFTGYGFRNWHYVTAMAKLTLTASLESVCLDSGCTMTLIDRQFLKRQDPSAKIVTRTSQLNIDGIGQSVTREFAVISLYLPGRKTNDTPSIAKIQCEVHIIDKLKPHMLIGMDVMGPHQIDLIVSQKIARIASCQTDVDIMITQRSKRIRKPLLASDGVEIAPQTTTNVPVKTNGILPEDRDFLFEPDSHPFALYTHVVDAGVTSIPVTNDSTEPMLLASETQLGHITEYDFDGCFPCHPVDAYLAKTLERTDPFQIPETESQPQKTELKLDNGITVFDRQANGTSTGRIFKAICEEFPSLWEDHGNTVKMPKDQWMRIPIKDNWQEIVGKPKAVVYRLSKTDQEVVNRTFDKLHTEGRLSWNTAPTPFSYPVFVVWRNMPDGSRKGRAVVDIRALNRISIPDVYPLPLQADILNAVQGCEYLSVLDGIWFFYQFSVHPDDRHKLAVVSHRGQEIFNVAPVGYCNSPSHVQRHVDDMLRTHAGYARQFVDDMIIFSKSFDDHCRHLRAIFRMLTAKGIALSTAKTFIGYPTVKLLGQKVDSFGLSTPQEKIEAISQLAFPVTLHDLEKYLGLTGWMRNYVPFYAQIVEPLQQRKTVLNKTFRTTVRPKGTISKPKRQSLTARMNLEHPTQPELKAFNRIQSIFSAAIYLVHQDRMRQLYADVDVSRMLGIGCMVYHSDIDPPTRQSIQPILFLSRTITNAERKFGITELETIAAVWMIRRIRHMIEAAEAPAIIYTDHSATTSIATQTKLTSSDVDKQNLRLVAASAYLSQFQLIMRHRPGKEHIVPDALSRLKRELIEDKAVELELPSAQSSLPETDLTVVYHATLVEFSPEFKQQLIDGYKEDPHWTRILNDVFENDHAEIPAHLPFMLDSNDLLYYLDSEIGPRLVIPANLIEEIFKLAHDTNGHPGLHRTHARISATLFIHKLAKKLKEYIKHCPPCQLNQTRRHKPYGSLQPILMPPIPYHTITIDFILALPETTQYNCAMTATCKFSKKITILPGRQDWSAEQWARALLQRLAIADWGVPAVIISDRDRKFASELWTEIFKQLNVRLLYSTAYHPQTDGQSERTNQTVEIALRYMIQDMDNPRDWPNHIHRIQAAANNSESANGQSPNEVISGFRVKEGLDLVKSTEFQSEDAETHRAEAKDLLAIAAMTSKHYYDQRHKPAFMKEGDWALVRLHKGYKLQTAKVTKKLQPQYDGPYQVKKRIGRLAYELDIPDTWNVHNVFSIAQLEPAPAPDQDPFRRPRPDNPGPVEVEDDHGDSFEIEKLLDRRQSVIRGKQVLEYLVKWKGWADRHNAWYKVDDLDTAQELIDEYNRNAPPLEPIQIGRRRGRPRRQ